MKWYTSARTYIYEQKWWSCDYASPGSSQFFFFFQCYMQKTFFSVQHWKGRRSLGFLKCLIQSHPHKKYWYLRHSMLWNEGLHVTCSRVGDLPVQSWALVPGLAVGRGVAGRERRASPIVHGHCHQSGRMFLHNNQHQFFLSHRLLFKIIHACTCTYM